VLDALKSMVVVHGAIAWEERYILDRMREFITKEEVYAFAAAEPLLTLIELSVCLLLLINQCILLTLVARKRETSLI
jgi:hypothetical protein